MVEVACSQTTPADPSDSTTVGDQHRLHPATMWLPVLEAVRGIAIPAVIASFVVGPWFVIPGVGLFVVLPTVWFQLIHYRTFRFRLSGDQIVIRSGWLSQRERRIPWDRVQETELQQGLLRRPLALAKLTLKTAGSDGEEASLDVIPLPLAQQVRAAVVRRQHAASDREESEQVQATDETIAEPTADFRCHLTLGDLVKGGLTSNLVTGVMAIVGAIFYFQFVAGFEGDRDPLNLSRSRVVERIQERSRQQEAFTEAIRRRYVPRVGPIERLFELIASETLMKSLAFAVGGLVLSVGRFVTKYHGFELTRRGNRLNVRAGLLTVNQNSLSRTRIQSLKLEEGLLRRWFGLASIYVDSAGDRESVDENKKREVLLPVASRAIAQDVAREAIPGLPTLSPDWQQVSRLAVSRGTKKGSALVILGMLQLAVFSPWLVPTLLPGFGIVYALNLAWYRNLGYSLGEHHFLFRKGWLNRSLHCYPVENIQNVVMSRSPFDRRLGLATLTIDTAGQSNTGGGATIRNLPMREAIRLRRRLVRRVSATAFSW